MTGAEIAAITVPSAVLGSAAVLSVALVKVADRLTAAAIAGAHRGYRVRAEIAPPPPRAASRPGPQDGKSKYANDTHLKLGRAKSGQFTSAAVPEPLREAS